LKTLFGGGAKKKPYLMDGLTGLNLSSPAQEGTHFC